MYNDYFIKKGRKIILFGGGGVNTYPLYLRKLSGSVKVALILVHSLTKIGNLFPTLRGRGRQLGRPSNMIPVSISLDGISGKDTDTTGARILMFLQHSRKLIGACKVEGMKCGQKKVLPPHKN